MDRLNVAIVGYGNLGQSLETLLLKDERYYLKYIFSRRDVKAGVEVKPIEKAGDYKHEIDFLFMCGGSKSDIESQSEVLAKDFNTIDCFDNHNHIESYLSKLDRVAKESKHTCVCCCGWDPGLFSMMRLLFDSVEGNFYTFWGKGVSQGHSQAIREIDGVKDAIQYTLPNKDIEKMIKSGLKPQADCKDFHRRQCFVVADGNKKQIKEKIVSMPDYFKGYKTTVNFVSKDEIIKHKILYHGGEVLTLNNSMNFSLKLDSNPLFTAKVMKAYGVALYRMFINKIYGAFSILDVAPKYLAIDNYIKYI